MPNAANATRRNNRLVLRAQTGDVSAWDALLAATQGWLHLYLQRLLKDGHLADEVLQEVFLLIFRKLRFLHEPRAYRAWVYRIATRQAFRHIRRERKRPDPPDGGDRLESLPAPAVHERPDTDWLNRVAQEIDSLSRNTRAVIVLHYFEGLSIRQVADVLDISPGTAKSRLARGLAHLRKRMPMEND